MSFLKYAEIYEAHRISGLAWSKFSRNIQIELALKDCKRKNCRDFLKVSRAEYDRLLESSPNIDRDIIGTFNKKFNTDYPNVRKPLICNGLKEITVYQSDDDENNLNQDNKKLDVIVEDDDENITPKKKDDENIIEP